MSNVPTTDQMSAVAVPVDLVERAIIALLEVGQQSFAMDLLGTLRPLVGNAVPAAPRPFMGRGYAAVNDAFRRAESEDTILKRVIRKNGAPTAGGADGVRACEEELMNLDRIHREAVECGSAMATMSAIERRKGVQAVLDRLRAYSVPGHAWVDLPPHGR